MLILTFATHFRTSLLQTGQESAFATSSGSWNTEPADVPPNVQEDFRGLAAKGLTAPLGRKTHPKQVGHTRPYTNQHFVAGLPCQALYSDKQSDMVVFGLCFRVNRRQMCTCCKQFGAVTLGNALASPQTYGQLASAS